MKLREEWSWSLAGGGFAALLCLTLADICYSAAITGEVVDAATGQPIAARIYIARSDGDAHFAKSAATEGVAIPYAKTNRFNPMAVEVHTTISAHRFEAALPPGEYTFTVERGKEYRALARRVKVFNRAARLEFRLHRWTNMTKRGWYSGDTHLHRGLNELPTLLLAEDLNVAMPQTYWAIQDGAAPIPSHKNELACIPNHLIFAAPTHVIWPRNTEYEVYRVGAAYHNLGAVFILNHSEPFSLGAPPLGDIASEAHRQGALIDMDKCDNPWSLMVAPVMKADLFELANNKMWRAGFSFTNVNEPAPKFMGLPSNGTTYTERDWMEYGFKTYYALLNCGFNLRPSAGTASGVHPVPPGFGRVYVHCPTGFSYTAWIDGLSRGKSFVTTGPMLTATIDGKIAGGGFDTKGAERTVQVQATILNDRPISAVEMIISGEVLTCPPLQVVRKGRNGFEASSASLIRLSGSCWVALRCWDRRDDGRVRFAHTAPTWLNVTGKPLRPRKIETEWLMAAMRGQIQAQAGVLKPDAVDEFRQALKIYETLNEHAR